MSQKKPLTLRGYRKLMAEHEQLTKVERPRVVVGVTCRIGQPGCIGRADVVCDGAVTVGTNIQVRHARVDDARGARVTTRRQKQYQQTAS